MWPLMPSIQFPLKINRVSNFFKSNFKSKIQAAFLSVYREAVLRALGTGNYDYGETGLQTPMI